MIYFFDLEEIWEYSNILIIVKIIFSWMKIDFLEIILIGYF